MYSIKLSTSAKKDLKKLPPQVQDEIRQIHSHRIQDSQHGIKLKGELKKYWKYAFRYKGTAYRIAYEIKQDILLIVIIIIGTRENFYKELKRRVKSRRTPALASALFFAVLSASLAFSQGTLSLLPGVAWGEPPSSTDNPPSSTDTPPPGNEQIIKIQAGRFGLNEVAKLLGLIKVEDCKKGIDQRTKVEVEICTAPDLRVVILKLIQVALGFTSLLVLIFVLYGGFTWTTAAGNAERVDKGRKILIWAGAGLVAVLLAWSVVTYVLYTASRVVA